MSNPRADALRAMMEEIVPEHVPASEEFKKWFAEKCQPVVLDQCLSELRRNDMVPPRIMGFMDDGTMGIVNLLDTFPTWGDAFTKNVTAKVHVMSARTPGATCSCFISETWVVKVKKEDVKDIEEAWDKHKDQNLEDHPERAESVTISALKYSWETNHMMQLFVVAEVLKVFGERTPTAVAGTQLGEIIVVDPLMQGRHIFKGRFIPSSKGDDDGKS